MFSLAKGKGKDLKEFKSATTKNYLNNTLSLKCGMPLFVLNKDAFHLAQYIHAKEFTAYMTVVQDK
jgi:hypothetical protein